MGAVERLVDACLLPGFSGTDAPAWVLHALDDGLAGVALYGVNLRDHDSVRRIAAQVHARRDDALVALDEEGGDVTRLDYLVGSRYPGNLALGVVDDEAATYALALSMASDLRRAGVDLDFAPSVDVNSDPDNPVIGVRSFGSDPALVGRHGAAFVRGLQDGGIVAVAKHFPGHGATRTDSHHSLPVIDDDEGTIRRRDLPPFVAAIDAGAKAVMTAHIVLPALDDVPATLSRRILTGLLREELGFDGAVVTDALDMAGVRERHGIAGAAVLALAAGADLLLLGAEDGERHRRDVQRAVARAVSEGDLPLSRLEDAARRVRLLAGTSPAGSRKTGKGDAGASASATNGAGSRAVGARNAGERANLPPPQTGDIGADVAQRALTVVGSVPVVESAVVVELRGSTNLAVGSARWSLADSLREVGAAVEPVQVTPKGPSAQAVAASAAHGALVVAVRDAHRSEWQQAWVRDLVRRRPDAILVCLGMPPDVGVPAVTAILAYGAARANTVAVARQLVGRGRPVTHVDGVGRPID